MEAKVSQQEPQPVWPQEGAQTPSFETPKQAAAFVAEVCGVTFDKIDFKPGDPSNPFDRASAWFPGIPRTGLFYNVNNAAGDPRYIPTEGATGIARGVLAGKITLGQLVEPYVPPSTPKNIYTGAGGGLEQVPRLLSPGEVDSDNPDEVVGTVVVDESEGELRVAIKLSDGTILPFTPQAARQLEIAGSNITSLHLRQGVFLTAEIASTDGYDPVRKVVEVYFEGE